MYTGTMVGEEAIGAKALPDPFQDQPNDEERFAVTRGDLFRVAIVAAGVGTRFEREGIDCDPASWMLAPRKMFDGRCAIEACLNRQGFERALVFNTPGAGFWLDADPVLLDELMADDDEPSEEDGSDDGSEFSSVPIEGRGGSSTAGGGITPFEDPTNAAARGDRLFTTSFVQHGDKGRSLVFAAAVVPTEAVFRERLFERYGAMAALGASVRQGFDVYGNLNLRLVSEHLANRLALIAANPSEATADGFSVIVEQRV